MTELNFDQFFRISQSICRKTAKTKVSHTKFRNDVYFETPTKIIMLGINSTPYLNSCRQHSHLCKHVSSVNYYIRVNGILVWDNACTIHPIKVQMYDHTEKYRHIHDTTTWGNEKHEGTHFHTWCESDLTTQLSWYEMKNWW